MKPALTAVQYTNDFNKPNWAPPSWVFGPVWTVLYILIIISFGYVGVQFIKGHLPFVVILPFLLNLLFNFAYIYIQFRFKNFALAALDVLLVLATLVWLMIVIYPFSHWVVSANIPYLVWVSFATVLQMRITSMN